MVAAETDPLSIFGFTAIATASHGAGIDCDATWWNKDARTP
jgi:hypothetical protein